MSKERKQYEEFQFCNKDIVVVPYRSCRECFFFDMDDCCDVIDITGSCVGDSRTDNTYVCFMQKERAEKLGLLTNKQ